MTFPCRAGLRRRAVLQSGALALLAASPWALAQSHALPLSVAINRSGKMRALSQRLSKAYVQATLDVLPDKARDIMLSTENVIATTLAEVAASNPLPDIRALLQALEKDSRTMAGIVAGNPRRDGIVEVVRTSDVMLESAERLTRAYEGRSQHASAKIVNIAGRQRMLSQRAARAFFLTAAGQDTPSVRKQLATARTEFAQALVVLQAAPISTPSIRNELDLAKSQWIFYEGALAKTANPDSLQIVATTSERIFEVMDNLASLYDAAVRDLVG